MQDIARRAMRLKGIFTRGLVDAQWLVVQGEGVAGCNAAECLRLIPHSTSGGLPVSFCFYSVRLSLEFPLTFFFPTVGHNDYFGANQIHDALPN